MDEVTVLIPFYKAEEFFDDCIASVLNQTLKPKKIVIVNDGSGAESARFLEKYKDVATIVNNENRSGVPTVRNILVSMAETNLIAFQDADDLWEPEKLERQVNFLNENPNYVGCHTGVTTFNDRGTLKTFVSKPSPLKVSDLMMGSHVTPPSLLIKREAVLALGGFDENFVTSSDYEFSIRLAKAGYLMGFISEPLIRVRRSSHGNISSNGFRTFKSHMKLLRKHRKTFLDAGGYSGIRKFVAKSLRESGGKVQGVKGRAMYRIGTLLG